MTRRIRSFRSACGRGSERQRGRLRLARPCASPRVASMPPLLRDEQERNVGHGLAARSRKCPAADRCFDAALETRIAGRSAAGRDRLHAPGGRHRDLRSDLGAGGCTDRSGIDLALPAALVHGRSVLADGALNRGGVQGRASAGSGRGVRSGGCPGHRRGQRRKLVEAGEQRGLTLARARLLRALRLCARAFREPFFCFCGRGLRNGRPRDGVLEPCSVGSRRFVPDGVRARSCCRSLGWP
jgi:hypothetical protein